MDTNAADGAACATTGIVRDTSLGLTTDQDLLVALQARWPLAKVLVSRCCEGRALEVVIHVRQPAGLRMRLARQFSVKDLALLSPMASAYDVIAKSIEAAFQQVGGLS